MPALPLVCAIFCILCLVGIRVDNRGVEAIGKMGAASAFVAYGVTSGLVGHGAHGWAFMVGLSLSMVGDAALLSKEPKGFLFGLAAFLLGHVAYAAGFLLMGVGALATVAGLLLAGGLMQQVWAWLGPNTGKMRGPVMAYMIVITSMVALAAGALGANPNGPRFVALIGAVLFAVSDIFVARHRFVSPGPENRFAGLPLYFTAQLLLAGAAAAA